MQVTTIDVCVPGFERLRSQSEFILATPISRHTTQREVVDELVHDWRSADHGIEASDDDIRALLNESIGTGDKPIDPDIEDRGEDDESCYLFVYIGN